MWYIMVSIDSSRRILDEMRKVFEERMREAARNDNMDIIQDLVDMGIDINARQPDNGWYLFVIICYLNFVLIKMFLF